MDATYCINASIRLPLNNDKDLKKKSACVGKPSPELPGNLVLASDSLKCFIWLTQSLKTFKPTFKNVEVFTQKPRLPISFEKCKKLVTNCCMATEPEAGSSCLSYMLICPSLLPDVAHSLRNSCLSSLPTYHPKYFCLFSVLNHPTSSFNPKDEAQIP